MQRAICHHDKSGAHDVATIGVDQPTAIGFVPTQFSYFSLQTGIGIQVKETSNCPAVLQNFGGI